MGRDGMGIDKAPGRRVAPVRVAMVGAGAAARAVALQLSGSIAGAGGSPAAPAIQLVLIADPDLEAARRAFREAGVQDPRVVHTPGALEDAIAAARPAITDEPILAARAQGVDILLEATHQVDQAAPVVLAALEQRKHVAMMNVVLDATLGPILKYYADRVGVVITGVDGDTPGLAMHLLRSVHERGLRPVLCAAIKGAQDPHSIPPDADTPRFARSAQWVTACADGTRIAFEQTVVANATGMRVARRGMLGTPLGAGADLHAVLSAFTPEQLLNGPGFVDYVVSAQSAPGVLVLATHTQRTPRQFLSAYKVGQGPFYLFHRPYSLSPLELPTGLARAVMAAEATVTPQGGPTVDVVAVAKRALKVGEHLDGIGGHTLYGQCENVGRVQVERQLPMGLAQGCRVKRPVARDAVLSYADVELPPGRLCDRLRTEQDALFAPASELAAIAG